MLLLVGLPQISETIYSPALPDIAASLMTVNRLVQWTLSVYFIGFASGVFIWGRLSDSTGRRFAMLAGLVVYVIGSVSCLLATSITWLLISRIIQGFGANAGSVIIQTIMREAFDETERHKIFSMTGFVLAFSIAVGPPVGGYINQWFNWRANFTLLVILGVLLTILSLFLLPETLHQKTKNTQTKTWGVLRQFLKDKHVLVSIWLIGATNGILFSYYAEAPFLFIKIVGLSPGEYGNLSLFLASAALIGGILSRRFSHFYTPKKIISIGCVTILISSLLLVLFAVSNFIKPNQISVSIVCVMIPMMGIVVGMFGMIIPAVLSNALINYKGTLGTAGALFGLSYYIIVALLTLIMGVIHNGTVMPMPAYFLTLSLIILFAYKSISIPKGSSN